MACPVDGSRWQAMAGSSAKLTRRQEEAIVAHLSQRNIEEAARVVGAGVRTLYRWLKEREFNAAYRSAKRASFSQSIARLNQMSVAAVTTLGKVMTDPSTPPSTRVRAADSILNHTAKAMETEDIEARVTELELTANASKPKRWK